MEASNTVEDLPHTPARHGARRRALGWLALAALVLGLHLLLGGTAYVLLDGRPGLAPAAPPLEVKLLPAQPLAAGSTPAASAKAHPAAPPRRRAPRVSPATPAPQPAEPATPAIAAAPADLPGDEGDALDSSAHGAATAAGSDTDFPGQGLKAPAADRFRLPASASLSYDTFFNGMPNQTGTIDWRTDGQQYRLSIGFSLPFVGRFEYASNGRVGASGLAPVQYVERRSRRDPSITRFEREAVPPVLRFTRSGATPALPAQAQDRFSVLVQLAGLVAGDPMRYQPGSARRFEVADTDSIETWTLAVVGREQLMAHGVALDTLHLMRLPRRPGDRRRIDIWLAASLQWLPARLLQTEPDGTQLELRIRPPGSSPGAPPAGVEAEPMRGS